jgi:release factor glutamine methyltransferase
MTTPTISRALSQAIGLLASAGVSEPRPDAEILLSHVVGCRREFLLTHPEIQLSAEQVGGFESALRERARRVPLAYITGSKEFYGIELEVSPAVMIPRPETETLVEEVLRLLAEAKGERHTVADLGTGCGNIAIAIAAHEPSAHVVATDASPPALRIAKRNAARAQVANRVACCVAELFGAFRRGDLFSAVVSNPPYIPTAQIEGLAPEIRDYEPRAAIDGGADGLSVIGRIVQAAPRHLKGGGILALEIGEEQLDSVARSFAKAGLDHIECKPDLSGAARVVVGRKPLGS